MKNINFLYVTILLVSFEATFAQKKSSKKIEYQTISAEQIKNIKAIPVEYKKRTYRPLDPDKEMVVVDNSYYVNLEVTLKDGSVLKTECYKLPGELSFGDFDYKVKGSGSAANGSLVLTLKSKLSKSDRYIVAEGTYVNRRAGMELEVWHKGDKSKKYKTVWKMPIGFQSDKMFYYYQSKDLKVNISLDSKAKIPTILLDILHLEGIWKDSTTKYIIYPNKESVRIVASGFMGESPGQNDGVVTGRRGGDGGDGGNISVTYSADALKYADRFEFFVGGGRGGKGGKGSVYYGPNGKDGRSGILRVNGRASNSGSGGGNSKPRVLKNTKTPTPENGYYEHKSNGLIAETANYKNGKLDGIQILFDSKGVKSRELNYKDGIKEGKSTVWNENGTLKAEYIYVNGNQVGLQKEYFKDGTLKREENLKGSKRDGNYKEYKQDGTLVLDCNYRSGKYHGPYKKYYDNGILKVEREYIDHNLNGEEIGYSKDGKVKSLRNWLAGKQNGSDIKYYSDGKIRLETMYKNGEKDGIDNFYKYNRDGKKYSYWAKIYTDGVIVSQKSYHENGKLKDEKLYVESKLSGLYKQYNADGSIYKKGQYIKGNKVGKWIKYNDNGSVKESTNY